MCTIKISEKPDKFTYLHFADFCQRINLNTGEIIKSGIMYLDLTNITFIDPFGMISIIGVCRHLFNKYKIHSSIILPNGEVGSYMERAGFDSIKEFESFIEVKRVGFSLNRIFGGKNKNGILTFFQNERELHAITKDVEMWMAENQYDEYEQSKMSAFISEMVQNVCQHSKTPQRGVLCAQAYKTTSGNNFFAWAIGDAGVGIRQSLLDADVPGIATMSDADTIQEVLKGRSSIQDDITRGNGFPNLFKEVKERSATLFIHSNDGIFGWNTSGMKQRKMVSNLSAVSGTTVSFIIG